MSYSNILNKIRTERKETESIDTNKVSELYYKFYRNFNQFPNLIKDYLPKDFENIDNELYRILENWHIDLDFGICLIGGTGNGKTRALLSILNKIVTSLSYDYIDSINHLIWVNYNELNSVLKKDIIEGESAFFKKLKTVQFLFIDDIGSNKNTDWNNDNLYSILDNRINFSLPTFFSSNNSLSKIKEELGDRLFSRILGLAVIYEIKGKDRRIDLHSNRLKQLKID